MKSFYNYAFITSIVLLLLGCSVQIASAEVWGTGTFNKPMGITVDSSGNVYVVDWNHRVQKFDSDGVRIKAWGTEGEGVGQFFRPEGVAIDVAGNVLVADTWNNRIQKFDANGNFISMFGGGVGFSYPTQIAVDKAGCIYVADEGNCRILKFNPSGGLSQIFQQGLPWGPLQHVKGVAVDTDGNVYGAVSHSNCYIVKYSSSGAYLANWGVNRFNGASGLAIDTEGTVYVTDTYHNIVKALTKDAQSDYLGFKTKWTGFSQPTGITLDNTGNYIYVADSGNNRIQRFKVSSNKFRPIPDGYQFLNFRATDVSWGIFENTYGTEETTLAGGLVRDPRALLFYYNHIDSSASGGLCNGMSTSALRVWSDPHDEGYPFFELGVDPNAGLPSPLWYIFKVTPGLTTTLDWLKSNHIRQFGLDYQNGRIRGSSNTDNIYIVARLNERLADPAYQTNPFVLGLRFQREGNWIGHCVVPIRIDTTEDETKEHIVIYDPNVIGQERYLLFDRSTGQVSSSLYGGPIYLNLVSNNVITMEPDISDFFSTTENAHLLFTDELGNHLGYNQGIFESEIPNADIVIPEGEDTQYPETYYLGGRTLPAELIGTGTGIASSSFMRPNGFALVNASVVPGSVDEIRVPESGSSVEFISGSGTESLELTIDLETENEARIATISGISVEPSKSVGLAFTQSGDSISIVNTGGAASVKVSLEQVGASPSVFIPSRLLEIDAMSSVRITPSDWTKLDQTLLSVEYDIGNDGTVDRSGNLAPEGYLSASFSTNVTTGIAPLAVQFTDTSTGSVAEWHWVFGDGMSSTEQNPVHVYSVPGTHTATLTVKAEGGVTDSENAVITVKSPAEATAELLAAVQNLDLPSDIRTGLTDKLNAAIAALNRGNGKAATGSLNAFVNQVNAQSGKAISSADADALIMGARTILTAIIRM